MSDILAREALQDVQRWQAPAVEAAGVERKSAIERRSTVYSARELEALQERAWQEGHRDGLEAGRKAGMESMLRKARDLQALIVALEQPLADVNEEVESELAELAIAVARQIIRRELRTEPRHVIAGVREALLELPSSSRQVHVHLHPKDAELVRESLANPAGETSWEIREDPVLERGSCRVTTATGSVDATLESRLATVAARVLGGDRDGDWHRDENESAE
jgi:flagellar assembly protein FliH